MPVNRIRPDPNQPRKHIAPDHLAQLVASIKRVGILQPITIRYIEGDDIYQIVSGECRFTAAKAANLETVPAWIKSPKNEEILLHQVIENWHRSDLNPFDLGKVHECSYFVQDKNRNLKKAHVRVACPFGLSPNDEFFLWGLLHLLFMQDDPSPEFSATPHFCLRQLGIVDATSDQGKRYEVFRGAIRRLAGVVYTNDHFYDPVRGEHRDVAFGFLKYSLPLDPESSRAWRIVWDQQFFQFCHAMRGSFQFDLDTYASLDYASRRLFLFLKKLFWRSDHAKVDLVHLGINILGFAPTIATYDLKVKVLRSMQKLFDLQILALPSDAHVLAESVHKRAKCRYDVHFQRGEYFTRPLQQNAKSTLSDSPAYELLKTIGFDDSAIRRIKRRYKPRMVQEWADITLAAKERKIITKDPKAYFNYYIQRAARRASTAPDWWLELRKAEERRKWDEQRAAAPLIAGVFSGGQSFDEAFKRFLQSEARETFEQITRDLTRQFTDAGRDIPDAKMSAEEFARQHMRNRFLSKHPEFRDSH